MNRSKVSFQKINCIFFFYISGRLFLILIYQGDYFLFVLKLQSSDPYRRIFKSFS